MRFLILIESIVFCSCAINLLFSSSDEFPLEFAFISLHLVRFQFCLRSFQRSLYHHLMSISVQYTHFFTASELLVFYMCQSGGKIVLISSDLACVLYVFQQFPFCHLHSKLFAHFVSVEAFVRSMDVGTRRGPY